MGSREVFLPVFDFVVFNPPPPFFSPLAFVVVHPQGPPPTRPRADVALFESFDNFRYMYEKIGDKVDTLETRVEDLGAAIIQSNALEAPSNFLVPRTVRLRWLFFLFVCVAVS